MRVVLQRAARFGIGAILVSTGIYVLLIVFVFIPRMLFAEPGKAYVLLACAAALCASGAYFFARSLALPNS